MIWFYFVCVIFGYFSFQIYIFLNHFFYLFFQVYPSYFGWFRILHCYFFGFAFYVVILPYNLCYKL